MTEVEKVKKILEPLTFIEAYYWLRKNGVVDTVEYDDGIHLMICLDDYPDVYVKIIFDVYEDKFYISLMDEEDFEPTVDIYYER